MMLTLRRAGVSDARVLTAFDQCVRGDFLDPAYSEMVQEDVAIPLPCGQTSLKPSLLALMLEALQTGPAQRILLVGAGSGYGAAILARLAAQVVGLERFHTLRDLAEANLQRAGLSNALVQLADGLNFTSALAFDRVLIAGAVAAPPAGLMKALKPGGVMVAPLISPFGARVAAIRPQAKGEPVQIDLFAVEIPRLEPGVAQRL